MIKVTLAGELSELFIDSFEAEVSSAKEVIECLSANFDGFVKYLRESYERGIGFVVRAGYQELDEDLLPYSFSTKVKSFTLTAVPIGESGGLGKILLGAAIIGVGFLSGGAGFLGISQSTLFLTGGAMVLAGVASFFGGNKNDKSEDSKKSLVFGGGEQTTQEGGRIPIVYGRHRTGIFVLSSRIHSYYTA